MCNIEYHRSETRDFKTQYNFQEFVVFMSFLALFLNFFILKGDIDPGQYVIRIVSWLIMVVFWMHAEVVDHA